MSFNNFYFEDKELNEGLFDFGAKLAKGSVDSLISQMKPASIKLNKIRGLIDPTKVDQITKETFDNMFKIAAADYGVWKNKSKDKAFIDKFILKLKEPFIKSYLRGVVNPSMKQEIGDTFDLSDKWVIDSVDVYKTTNGGNILLMKIVDPYDGEIDDIQINPTSPKKIEKNAISKTKYYIALDNKASQWFVNKKNMPYKQYISLISKYSADQLQKEIEDEYNKIFGKEDSKKSKTDKVGVDSKEKVEKPKSTKPNEKELEKPTWEANITKSLYNDLMYLKSFNLKTLLGDEFKKSRKIADSKSVEEGRTFYTDRGIIRLIKLKNGKHMAITNDAGKDVLEMKNIIEPVQFSEK